MISILSILENKEIEKIEQTKNYVVEKYPDIEKDKILGYRKKVIIDRNGLKHLVNLAIVRDGNKTKTVATSFWRSKESPKSQELLNNNPVN